MSKKYIRQHLGLGDHIICNGLVRHFCNNYNDVTLFCKIGLYRNVKFMFRDIDHLDIISFRDDISDYLVSKFIEDNHIDSSNIINIGFDGLSGLNMRFDKAFYVMCGFDPQFRLDNFYCERDLESEEYIFNFLNPNNEKYIFVIDDDNHHFGSLTIDESRLPKQYKIIKYNKTLNYNDDRFLMYNYRKILENAEEIHMFQSAFFEFVNSIELKNSKIYLHLYLRDYSNGEPILSKNNLTILK